MPRLLPGPSFLRLIEYPKGLPPRAVSVLERIDRGELDGVVVRGVLSADEVDRAVAGLEQQQSSTAHHPISPDTAAFTLGPMLVTSPTGMDAYLASTAATDAMLDTHLGAGGSFRARVLGWLGTLSGSGAVHAPSAGADRAYGIASVRCLPPGSELVAHCEAEQFQQPAYADFHDELAGGPLLSYFVALNDTLPDRALVVYDLRADGPLTDLSVDDKRRIRERVEGYPCFEVPMRKGDLILFNGGRYYHRVRPTEGVRSRWTVGGFVSFARDRRCLVWA